MPILLVTKAFTAKSSRRHSKAVFTDCRLWLHRSSTDSSQDLVFSRLYFTTDDDQQIKAATTQVVSEYELPLS
jgi:hypothetical protein